MKKTIAYCIVLCFVLIATGCRALLLKMYGIKDPAVETRATITAKARKFGLDTTNIVAVTSEAYLNVLKNEAHGIPDAAVFNALGEYIEYRETDTSCNAGLFRFIPGLTLQKAYTKNNKTTLAAELEKCRNLSGTGLAKEIEGKADFYVLVYWTVYSGRLNKDHVKVWEQQALENKNCTVSVIKVDLDWQAWWDKQEQGRIINRMQGKNNR